MDVCGEFPFGEGLQKSEQRGVIYSVNALPIPLKRIRAKRGTIQNRERLESSEEGIQTDGIEKIEVGFVLRGNSLHSPGFSRKRCADHIVPHLQQCAEDIGAQKTAGTDDGNRALETFDFCDEFGSHGVFRKRFRMDSRSRPHCLRWNSCEP